MFIYFTPFTKEVKIQRAPHRCKSTIFGGWKRPNNCIVHAAFHSFTTVVEQWSVSRRTDPEHGKTSLLLTFNLNYLAAGGQTLYLLPVLQKVKGHAPYTCWDLKWWICLIQLQRIKLHADILKGTTAFTSTYFLLSVDFIVFGEERGDSPASVWE